MSEKVSLGGVEIHRMGPAAGVCIGEAEIDSITLLDANDWTGILIIESPRLIGRALAVDYHLGFNRCHIDLDGLGVRNRCHGKHGHRSR
jgi:hypothetical protein